MKSRRHYKEEIFFWKIRRGSLTGHNRLKKIKSKTNEDEISQDMTKEWIKF